MLQPEKNKVIKRVEFNAKVVELEPFAKQVFGENDP